MSILTTTLRERTRGTRVLVVHDPGDDLTLLCRVLSVAFVVSEATTPVDAVERVGELPYACVVCAATGEYRIQEFLTEVARTAPRDAKHAIFVPPAALVSDVVIYTRSDDGWERVQELPSDLATIPPIIDELRSNAARTIVSAATAGVNIDR